ncbi:cell wall protein RBR3 isoform X1 [Rhodamnia argentea]|uniref:Cell wall protein RBR3 isoform X1 n=1 Tax=Rhodamnia argentea TaxID=178133 RepID=A0ABM3HM69_9MYRT|nr:cell wall protein RBR3 isoform X1 [Rhodamnia argentea]
MASSSNNSNSASPSTSTSTPSTPPVTGSSSGKRSRDPADDEVYLDNLYSHKRYLSEMMASSLNGLTVGDTLDNYMDSPARSESMFYFRDDMSSQYSPMSEDSDDSRFCEIPINACSSQSDSLPTSPVSPYRCQRPFGCPSSASLAASSPSYSHNLVAPTSSQTRQRGSDSEGRFPSSPSDICHSADLRRAALLRSVQMRTQPAPNCPYESPFAPGHEAVPNMESEDVKSLSDEKDYQIEECPSSGASSSHFNEEKTCRSPNSSTGRVESGI